MNDKLNDKFKLNVNPGVLGGDGFYSLPLALLWENSGKHPSRMSVENNFKVELFEAYLSDKWDIVSECNYINFEEPEDYSKYYRRDYTTAIVKRKDSEVDEEIYLYWAKKMWNEEDDGDGPSMKMESIGLFTIYFKNNSVLKKELYEDIEYLVKNCVIPVDNEGKFHILGVDGNGKLKLEAKRVKKMDVNVNLNYGIDFENKDKFIKNSLKNTSSGIILFYGPPGTGKSTYLRALIEYMTSDDESTGIGNVKKVIYMPSTLAAQMMEPAFSSFISAQKGRVVLVIEDAEAVLKSRTGDYSDQAVSNILNMTDGILNDGFRLQVIATFNAPKSTIDTAVFRAGRCIAEHEFKLLTGTEATALSAELGFEKEYIEDVSLAAVFAGEDQDRSKARKKVGFG